MVIRVVTAHFSKSAIRFSSSRSSAAWTTEAAIYPYSRGTNRALMRLMSTSENSAAAICLAAAPVTAPVAAVSTAAVGSSTLAKEVIRSMLPVPMPNREFTSAAATAATASVPAREAALTLPRCVPPTDSARAQNSRITSSSAPDLPALFSAPLSSRVPVSSRLSSPSSSVAPYSAVPPLSCAARRRLSTSIRSSVPPP